jgi:hypothetical protein
MFKKAMLRRYIKRSHIPRRRIIAGNREQKQTFAASILMRAGAHLPVTFWCKVSMQ